MFRRINTQMKNKGILWHLRLLYTCFVTASGHELFFSNILFILQFYYNWFYSKHKKGFNDINIYLAQFLSARDFQDVGWLILQAAHKLHLKFFQWLASIPILISLLYSIYVDMECLLNLLCIHVHWFILHIQICAPLFCLCF